MTKSALLSPLSMLVAATRGDHEAVRRMAAAQGFEPESFSRFAAWHQVAGFLHARLSDVADPPPAIVELLALLEPARQKQIKKIVRSLRRSIPGVERLHAHGSPSALALAARWRAWSLSEAGRLTMLWWWLSSLPFRMVVHRTAGSSARRRARQVMSVT